VSLTKRLLYPADHDPSGTYTNFVDSSSIKISNFKILIMCYLNLILLSLGFFLHLYAHTICLTFKSASFDGFAYSQFARVQLWDMIIFYLKVSIEFCHVGFRAPSSRNRKRCASIAVGSAAWSGKSRQCFNLVLLARVSVWKNDNWSH